MRVLVTGGAGFIGRWLCHALLARGDEVVAFDDLSNGSEGNVAEFSGKKTFRLVKGDLVDRKGVDASVGTGFDLCLHLGALVEVQRSIDDPWRAYAVNVAGTMNLLEACRRTDTKLHIVSTCMVYDAAAAEGAITEEHPVNPASPYASTKLSAEYLALSYRHAYGLPVVVTRPFNTYGPFQKTNQEGGVVAVFVRRALDGKPIDVFGEGTQTRDLMYIEDCVDFLLRASLEKRAEGEILNAGTGRDVAINDLAALVSGGKVEVRHVKHPHPQSEIRRLRCDPSKARRLLGWEAKVPLEEGVRRLREWMAG